VSEGRVLVIDDSEVILAKAKEALTEAGYEVTTTTQTVGAARFLRTCDIVLVDFNMPGIDGVSVLHSLQSAARSSDSSCAFYLFTSDDDIAIRYAAFGFDGSIRNKGDNVSLVGQVRAALRMKKMRAITRKSRPEGVSVLSHNEGPRFGGSVPPPPPTPPPSSSRSGYPPSSRPGQTPPPPPSSAARRTGFPPPRPATLQEEDDDDELTADLPRTPT
jgi:DNA-binding NarL/FixJ family response regulator